MQVIVQHVPLVDMDRQLALQALHAVDRAHLVIYALLVQLTNMEELLQLALVVVVDHVGQAIIAVVL